MQGTWLTKTKKAYVYRNRKLPVSTDKTRQVMDEGWYVTMLHGDNLHNAESFWYATFELAVRAIPQLWRH